MCENAPKTIRFIDSSYRTLFTVPDGANIVLTTSDGEKLVRSCKFLDEYHTQIGNFNVYHICEFAEKMERAGTTYAPEIMPALPDQCYSVLPSTGALILIEKGKKGYTEVGFSSTNPITNRKMADDLNGRRGVYRQQEAAMVGGSMFGWSTPAAKIASYDVRGDPIAPSKYKAKPPRDRGMEI